MSVQSAIRAVSWRDMRLSKHSDYQRVYRQSRKQFSSSMTYFFSVRPDAQKDGARIGLTAGRVLGKAVDRNRIKRRMREAVRSHAQTLTQNVDVVLHPRRVVLDMDFAKLAQEVGRIFQIIERATTAERTRNPR